MVVNENNPKIWASLIAPNPDDVTYWVDLTADPHGNIIKFYDNNDEEWYNLTSPTSDYAVYPYIGPNGNWFIENRDSGVRAQGEVPNATINGHRIADNPVLTKEDIGLGNVANLAPEDYPVPDAVYGLIDGKVDETRTINGHTLDADVVITKSDIGLGNVENVAPADMPISTATATALSGKVDTTRNIVAGSGLIGGGNLTADRTINIVSATDGITVNADNIQLNTNNTLTSTSTTQALSAAQGKVLNDKNIAQDAALLERPIMIDPTGDVITPSLGAYSKDEADAKFVAKTQIVQTEGTSTTNVMSQKAVTDELTALETDLNVLNSDNLLSYKKYGNFKSVGSGITLDTSIAQTISNNQLIAYKTNVKNPWVVKMTHTANIPGGIVLGNPINNELFIVLKNSSPTYVEVLLRRYGAWSTLLIKYLTYAGNGLSLVASGGLVSAYVDDKYIGNVFINDYFDVKGLFLPGIQFRSNSDNYIARDIIYIERPSPYCHFSIDDVCMKMKELSDSGVASIFDNPYFLELKKLHDEYGVCITLNLFYTLTTLSGWNLSNMTSAYKSEFRRHSSWLKFGFHGGNETSNYNNSANNDTCVNDYINVLTEIERFASLPNIDLMPRLSFFSGNKELYPRLKSTKWGLYGVLCADDTRVDNAGLTALELTAINNCDDYINMEEKMYYVRSEYRLDNADSLSGLNQVKGMYNDSNNSNIFELFLHEGSFIGKIGTLEAVFGYLRKMNVRNDFAMNNLPTV